MNNAAHTARITNDETAASYLDSLGMLKNLTIEDGKVVQVKECRRCWGSGTYSFNGQHSRCYQCDGRPETQRRTVRIHLKAFAQAEKRRRTAEEKRRQARLAQAAERHENMIEGQRNWCEANGHGRITFAELDTKRAEQRKAERANSQHVGTVGERREFTAKVVFVTSWDTAYGVTILTVMVDADGNKLVQKGKSMNTYDDKGSLVVADKGDTIKFKATVKEHGSREGEKQTRIARPKISGIEKA